MEIQKIDTTSNSISNVQLIPTPSKMEYAIYNLGDNSIEASTIDIHKPEYKELKLDWGTVSDIVYDGIRFKKENSDNEADGIYALLAYDFESMTVFRIMSSSSVDYVLTMLLSDVLKSFDCKRMMKRIQKLLLTQTQSTLLIQEKTLMS